MLTAYERRRRRVGGSARRRGAGPSRDGAGTDCARLAAAGRTRAARCVLAGRDRRHGPLPASGRRLGGRCPRREHDRHDRDGIGEVAGVQPSGHRRGGPIAEDASALPLSDEGARAGSGPSPGLAPTEGATARDLRRRHRDGASLADPQVGERHPHQPGHAAHRRSAASRPLGRRVRKPPLRRRRRGARLPGCLRVTRGERPSAPAPDRPAVRCRSAVPPRLGHDRQRGRARRGADGNARHGGRARRRTSRGTRDRNLESAAPRRRARFTGEHSRRGVPPDGRIRLAWAPDDLLHEEPQGRGGRAPVHGRARRSVDCPAAGAVPRRLYRRAAARDRAASRRR